MDTKILEVYKALHPQVLQLHVRWAQFRFLFTVSDERVTVLSNLAPGFFAIVRDVLRDDAIISLGRLTDKSRTLNTGNLSMVTLVELAEKSSDTELAISARNLLEQLLKRVENIKPWRNKWIAHTDLEEALSGRPLLNVKFQRRDIDDAIRLIRELMNLFADHLSEQQIAYELPIIVGDADVLARILEEL